MPVQSRRSSRVSDVSVQESANEGRSMKQKVCWMIIFSVALGLTIQQLVVLTKRFLQEETAIKMENIEVTTGDAVDKWFQPVLCPQDWLNITKIEEEGVNKTALLYAISCIPHADLYPARHIIQTMTPEERSAIYIQPDQPRPSSVDRIVFSNGSREQVIHRLNAELEKRGLTSVIELLYRYTNDVGFGKAPYAINMLKNAREQGDPTKKVIMVGSICHLAIRPSINRFIMLSDRAFMLNYLQTIYKTENRYPKFYIGLSVLEPYIPIADAKLANHWNVNDVITQMDNTEDTPWNHAHHAYGVQLKSVERLSTSKKPCGTTDIEAYQHGSTLRISACIHRCNIAVFEMQLKALMYHNVTNNVMCSKPVSFPNDPGFKCGETLNRTLLRLCSNNCRNSSRPCKTFSYRLKRIASSLPETFYVNRTASRGRLMQLVFVVKDVDIQSEYRVLPPMEFIGIGGGILGVFLGASFITIIEVGERFMEFVAGLVARRRS